MCRNSPVFRKYSFEYLPGQKSYGYDSANICILQDVLIVLMFLSLTRHGDVPGDVSGELDDVRKVVLVPAVVLATVRLKQVITWKRLLE